MIQLVLGAIALALSFITATVGYMYGKNEGRDEVRAEWNAASALAEASAQAKKAENEYTAEAALIEYRTETKYIEKFIPLVEKETRYETVNLASCPLDAGDVRLLNDTFSFLFNNGSPPTGRTGPAVPNPSEHSGASDSSTPR